MTTHISSPRRLRLFAGALTLLAAGLLTSGPASATAIANASADATLTVNNIISSNPNSTFEDLVFTLDKSLVSLEDVFTQGSGSGTAVGTAAPKVDPDAIPPDAPIPLGVNDTVSLSATANATAVSIGLADSLALTEAFIFLENAGNQGETFTIDFTLDYSASADVMVDEPVPLELAFSGAFVAIFDLLEVSDLLVEILADSELGPLDDTVTDARNFSLILAPFEVNELTLFVDASALAEAVPTPGTLLLLGSGLLLLARRRVV